MKQLRKNRILKSLSSIKITVICLSLLFILTLWGTIDQVNNGLYLAQERFFNSLIFLIGGYVPFPGARLVLWVLFINLVSASITRLVYRWRQAGIILIHSGLLLFFVAAFVTFHGTEESQLTLSEGEGRNVSANYNQWELSVWEIKKSNKNVFAYPTKNFSVGDRVEFTPHDFSVRIDAYYPNSEAFLAGEGQTSVLVNPSNIQVVKPIPVDKEPERNVPGGIFSVYGTDQKDLRILLYGGENVPAIITKNNKTYAMQLRHKRHVLPFILKLKDFRMEVHPNTEMARSYESLVEVISNDTSREVLISMNEPLRYKDFTFYQASYAMDQFGRELSTLAVVKNSGRLLPYVASLATFAGLLLHLILMAFGGKKR